MQLQDSFSMFFLALKMDSCPIVNIGSIWKRSGLEPERNYFFNHVQDFFIKNNARSGDDIDKSCCLLYELQHEQLNELQHGKLLILNQLFSRYSQATLEGGLVNFKIINENTILSPKIIYNPLSEIAVLSFTFSLKDSDRHLQNLIDFNYQMRVFGRRDSSVFALPKKRRIEAQKSEDKLEGSLNQFNNGFEKDDQNHYWDINTLLSILMQDLPESTVVLSPQRLQVFTYLRTLSKLSPAELSLASFLLRRLYNHFYTPSADFLQNNQETNQTFEHIHCGSSIEGCVVIVNGDEQDLPGFLKQYGAVIKNRFIWSYILVYYQRLSLIEMNEKLSGLFEKERPDREKLLNVASDLSSVQLRIFFNQVSYYSQHNDFFEFCKRNMKVYEMLGGIKEKLEDVNSIIQQKQSEEEKIKDKKRENKDRILEVMIAALLIPEIIYEFFSTLAHVLKIECKWQEGTAISRILLIFFILLMLPLFLFVSRMYKDYFQAVKSYFTKEAIDDNIGLKKRFTKK